MALADQDAVTVVIPTHDRLALLLETLRSVTRQLPTPRIVVVDDGSTDATAEALAARELIVVGNPAGGWGSARARNAGLERVSTPFVAFVDSDDLLLPGALTQLVAALRAAPAAPFCFGRGLAATRVADGWVPEGLVAPLTSERPGLAAGIYARNFVPSSGALVRTDAARAIGGYDPDLAYSEDQDFWLRLCERGEPVHVAALVSVHRRHGGNRHLSARAMQDDDTIARRGLARAGLAAQQPARLGMQLCEEALDAARSRRPAELARAARRLLLGHEQRTAILAATGRHFRRRRTARAAGSALWEADPSLRSWLAGYA